MIELPDRIDNARRYAYAESNAAPAIATYAEAAIRRLRNGVVSAADRRTLAGPIAATVAGRKIRELLRGEREGWQA